MIEYQCPKCRESIAVPDSQAGQTETCPECGNVAAVPKRAGITNKTRLTILLAAGGLAVVGLAIGAIVARPNASPGKTSNSAQASNPDGRNAMAPPQQSPPRTIQPPSATNTPATMPQPVMPPIQDFEAFAKRLTAQIEKHWTAFYQEGFHKYHANDYQTLAATLSGVDYKRTDSIVNPVVAVATIRECRTIYWHSAETGNIKYWHEVTHKNTIHFTFKNSKWVPVKCFRVTEQEKYVPQEWTRKTSPFTIGLEEEWPAKWVQDQCDKIQ